MSSNPGITVEVSDAPLLERLQQLGEVVGDQGEVLDEMGAALMSNVELRMRKELDPNRQPWEALALSTLEGRTKGTEGERHQILRDTGIMANSLNHKVVGDGLVLGFGQQHALYHEFGAPRNNMPRRGLLMADPEAGELGQEDQETVLEVVQGWLDDVAQEG